MLEGFAQREKGDMRKRAWTVSHSLIAAGCKPEHVTVEKLLGEPEKRERRRRAPKSQPAIDEIFRKMPRMEEVR